MKIEIEGTAREIKELLGMIAPKAEGEGMSAREFLRRTHEVCDKERCGNCPLDNAGLCDMAISGKTEAEIERLVRAVEELEHVHD